jgi:ATP-dependent DNA helicase RecG
MNLDQFKNNTSGRLTANDFNWILGQTEGQFFERKSCIDRSQGRPTRRPAREVARDIAKTLAAMANADGGVLVVGIEDDGAVTGVDYPEDRLAVLHNAPRTHVKPPLRASVNAGELAGRQVLLFDVDWSAEVHQLTDGRYLLRIGDQNIPFPAQDIETLKEGKRRRITEIQFLSEATLADIDLDLVNAFAENIGLQMNPEQLLERYRLAERRNGRIFLTLAALLLFGKDPGKWHAHCDIDFVKYEGTERLTGAALNVIKRDRLEAPFVRLIELAFQTVQPHVREKHQLVNLFFEERLEYPTFAWQEAIVNAIAHRDYRYEGLGIEIWMFDDRLEIRSPGALVEPVTLERLQRLERIHASRNPRIVRVLTDCGFMREQGEGIPRMFETMELQGLYPPKLRLEADAIFTVTLRNTPVYEPETLRWLEQYESLNLSGNQKRLLAYARDNGGSFTSRAYQKLVGVDIYTASRDIKNLIRWGVVRLKKKGGRIYELTPSPIFDTAEKPEELIALEAVIKEKGFIQNQDIRVTLGVTRRQATRIAQQLVSLGWLEPKGERRGSYYVLKEKDVGYE